jgi:hypothetical protein
VPNELDAEKLFAFTIASVKDISEITKEAMEKDFIHIALELLEEEKNAMYEALKTLKTIDDGQYQKTFGEMIPNKLKDIEFAIKFCNNRLIEGKFILPTDDQEYKIHKRKQEIKIKNFKKLKTIAHATKQWGLVMKLDKEIEKAEMLRYQA